MSEQYTPVATVGETVEYRDIARFPGYRVGDDGSVWSKRKRGSHSTGLADDWHRVSPLASRKGRHRVYLYSGKHADRVRLSVPRLVLEVFVGTCPPGMEAAHEDGNPSNNALNNLRWDTPQGNWQDRIRHGNDNRGEKNNKVKLTRDDVLFIRANADNYTRRALAARFGVTRQLITMVIQRKCWAWLK